MAHHSDLFSGSLLPGRASSSSSPPRVRSRGWRVSHPALTVWLAAGLLLATTIAARADQDFVVMGEEGVYLKQNSTIVSGDVGANRISNGPFLAGSHELTVGIGSTVQSPTVQVLGDSLKLKNNAQVYDIHYNDLSGLGDVLGQEFTPIPLPLVPALPPVPPFAPPARRTSTCPRAEP